MNTLDFGVLAPRRNWILADPTLVPALHAPELWDHIDGLPANLSDVVTVGDSIYNGNAEIRAGTLQAPGRDAAKVAIKVLPSRFRTAASSEESAKRTAREIKVWRTLRHRNILQFHGVFISDRFQTKLGEILPAMVMPLCEDGNLMAYLDKKNPEARRLPLVLDIARGLRYLHTYDIVHGDVKPLNILVRRSGDNIRAVIIDFGSSRILGDEGYSLDEDRTWRYVALEFGFTPYEQFHWIITKESDIFSFAMTALQVISGKEPFHEMEAMEATIHMRTTGERPSRANHESAEISDGVWQLLEACWAQEPQDRMAITPVFARLLSLTN